MHSSNTSVGMPSSNAEFGQIRVHVLYKRAEIPAKAVILGSALSVTYRKQESPANTGSTPVSATKSFIIIGLQNRRMELGLRRSAKDRGLGLDSRTKSRGNIRRSLEVPCQNVG